MSLRIRKGDRVTVLAGKDKGKSGRVLHVFPKKNRALIEGINMVKKHLRRSRENPQGMIANQEIPIHLSNLALICPVSSKPARIKTLISADGSKQRAASKSKAVFA